MFDSISGCKYTSQMSCKIEILSHANIEHQLVHIRWK